METEVVSVSITKIIKEQADLIKDVIKDFHKLMEMGFDDSIEIVIIKSNACLTYAFSEAQVARCREFMRVLVRANYSVPQVKLFASCMYQQCGDNLDDYPKLYTYTKLYKIEDILFRIAYWTKDVVQTAEVLSGEYRRSIKYYSREDCGIVREELARIGRIRPYIRFISCCYSLMRHSNKSPNITEVRMKIRDSKIPPNAEAREIHDVFRKISETIDYSMIEGGSYYGRYTLLISPKLLNIYNQNMGEIVAVCLKYKKYIIETIHRPLHIHRPSHYRIIEYVYGIVSFIDNYIYFIQYGKYSYLVTTKFCIQEMKAILHGFISSFGKFKGFEAIAPKINSESADKFIREHYTPIDHFLA